MWLNGVWNEMNRIEFNQWGVFFLMRISTRTRITPTTPTKRIPWIFNFQSELKYFHDFTNSPCFNLYIFEFEWKTIDICSSTSKISWIMNYIWKDNPEWKIYKKLIICLTFEKCFNWPGRPNRFFRLWHLRFESAFR